jgi:hypothetical protein
MAPRYQDLHEKCLLFTGDYVQIISAASGGQLGWQVDRLSQGAIARTDAQIGHVYKILEDCGVRGFRLDISRLQNAPDRVFPFFVLKKVDEEAYNLDSPQANG